MAQRLLLNVLVSVLGDFVDGLTEENLKIGVWSGKIIFHHLKLNKEGIKKLKLPFDVKSGYIQTLEVVIPWATLEYQPVKIDIDGVYLLLTPVNIKVLSQKELEERIQLAKSYQLNELENKIRKIFDQQNPADTKATAPTYFNRLTTKILDNLEIKLNNIHLRVEDSFTFAPKVVSYGATIDSFVVSTTNQNWEETFIARSNDGNQQTQIHKLAKLQNLTIYWNMDSVQLSTSDIDEWLIEMHALIFKSSRQTHSTSSHMDYILEPPNALIVKIQHNESSVPLSHLTEENSHLPKIKTIIESIDLRLRLDKLQYHQIMQTLDDMKYKSRILPLLKHRPQISVRSNPRLWWRYALMLVSGKDSFWISKLDTALLCCKHRKRYMQLALGRRIVDGETGLCDSLSQQEEEEFIYMESVLPLEALAVFRELSIKEALIRNHLSKRSAEKKKALSDSNSNSWMWLGVGFTYGTNTGDFSSVSTDDNDDDLTPDSLDRFFPGTSDANISPASSFTMEFTLQSSSALQFTLNSVPLCRLNMSLTFDGSIRSEKISFIFQMTEILMIDQYTPNAVIRNLISVKPEDRSPQKAPLEFDRSILDQRQRWPLVIQIDSEREKIRVRLTALPLEVCLNKHCVQQLLSMFQVPQITRPALVPKLATNLPVNHEAIVQNDHDFLSSASLEFVFEAEAPKIIVPEHSSVEIGYLLLDTGHLSVKGALSPSGMWWDISLNSVNAGLPLISSEMYIFSEQSLYLIRPFNVHTTVQTFNRSRSDMTVTVGIKPGICGEIDAPKLSRVMHLIQVISQTFRPQTSSMRNISYSDLPAVNPAKCSILVEAHIPEVSLVMQYNILSNHFGTLSVPNLTCSVQLRPYDMEILVDLQGLTIEDSLRCDNHRYIVSSPMLGDNAPQVHISYVSMTHKASPFYKSHASEILVSFTHLYLHCDPHSILFIRPFYEVILGKRLQKYPPDDFALTQLSDSLPSGEISQHLTAPVGMHVVVTFDLISCELLRFDNSLRGPSILESSLHHKLATMFLVDLNRLHVDVKLHNLISTDVSILSTNIIDTREMSKDYHFKTIVKPSHSSNSLNLSQWSQATNDAPLQHIVITYRQETQSNSFVDILVRDITGYLSLDTILDLVDVSLKNTFAALELVRPLDKSENMETSISHSPSDPRKLNINVHVSVPNPQLILLEDPMSKTTRGIVGRCGIDFKYNRETIFGSRVEVLDAIHLSVMDNEIFVLPNMENWNPHQILYPMTLELHINRTIESDMAVSTSLAFDMDTIAADVSLNDIILAQSIMLRQALIKSPVPQNMSQDVPKLNVSENTQSILTAYLVNVNIGTIVLTMVNDFQGKLLPLVKIKVDGTTFSCDGVVEDLRGNGSLILALESFNNKVANWEPLIEPWHPRISFNSSSTFQQINIKSEHTLQFTISSTFLETIRHTQSILFNSQEYVENRTAIPSVTFENHFGVPVDIVNSSNQSILFHLDHSEKASIYIVHQTTGYIYPQQRAGVRCEFMTSLPETVDVILGGDLGLTRLPISRLSLNNTKAKRCVFSSKNLQLLEGISIDSAVSIPQSTDPIVEEVFECERYNPLIGEWDTPFLVGDPPKWADTSGSNERLRESVMLPPNGQWEWSTPWILEKLTESDISGPPDQKGWKYARNFNGFLTSAHNACTFLDAVRRRRWYRIRTPVASGITDTLGPLSFIWDSHILEDGSKVIRLRSFLQVRNRLSYPVSILLQSKSWRDGHEIGPVSPGDTISIPLAFVSATSLQVRPRDQLSKWSQNIRCTLFTSNHTHLQDILCFDSASNTPVPIRTVTEQEEKSLLISMYAPIQITNSLPCRLKLRFFNSLDIRNISGTIICVEEVLVPAGATVNLRNISLTCELVVSVSIGRYGWSQPRVIKRLDSKDLFTVSYAHANGTIAFQFFLLFVRSLHQSCEIHLYSEWALVDRTGLDISIMANANAKGTRKIQRSSYVPSIQGYEKSPKRRLTLSPDVASNSSSHSQNEESYRSVAAIDDIVAKSSHQYSSTIIDIGTTVYSDRDYVFTYLPFLFRGQMCLQTASNDTSLFLNDSSLLEFKVCQTSIVILLIDKKLKIPPSWILVSGFKRIYDQCIASPALSDNSPDIHYSIYGKIFRSWDTVSLGYQYSSKFEVQMYCVIVLPGEKTEFNSTLLSLLSSPSDDKVNTGETELCWIHGNKGLSLFSTFDGFVSIGLKQGTVWTPKGINLKVLGTAKGPFEVFDSKLNRSYQLAYNIVPMPGSFSKTKVLTIMPRYCIVNCCDEALEIRQRGSQESMYIEPFACDSWHKLNGDCSTAVHLKSLSSRWSFGCVDLNEVGSTELLLPSIEEADLQSHCFPSPIILNVNIQIADPEDNCAVVIVIWKSKPHGYSSLSIRNDSETPITIRQAFIRVIENGEDKSSLFEIHAAPHTWIPFGWTDPDEKKHIQLSTSETFENNNRIAKFDVQSYSQKLRIPYGIPRKGLLKEVVLSIESLGSGRVVRVMEAADIQTNCELEVEQQFLDEQPLKEFKFSFSLTSIGLSLVADSALKRKELLSLYIENLSASYSIKDIFTNFELSCQDIQIDNYSETAVYPVLFRKVKNSRRQRGQAPNSAGFVFNPKDDNSLISFAFSKESSPANPSGGKYHYLSLRLLEFAFEIDSGTIYQLLETFFSEIKVRSKDDILASSQPSDWILSYSRHLLSVENRFQYVDIYKSQVRAQESKLYFEHLILHPIKILLTFLQTEYTPQITSKSKSISSSILDLITSAVAVELMEIKLNSFIVTNARESVATLQSRILTKMWQDVRGQLGTIAGSLSILGSPAGLARNIGNGVQDFFYEPYLGLVQSPEEFLRGIRNGTSSLMVGVVAGTLNSTATLIGSASSGISYLSGDSEFIKQRTLSRQKIHASRHGAIDSLKDGGEQVILGITSGVSGIFLKPFEEAQKDGAMGFLRGVGFGVVGAAVKPVLGIADGISSLAHGISNELGDSSATHQVRPPRAFGRSSYDPSVLILAPLNLVSAEAQHFVKHQAYEKRISDEYIADYKAKRGSQLILSEHFLYWRLKETPLTSYSWTQLSHCVFLGEKIGLYLYGNDTNVPVLITCRNEDRAIQLYSLFVQHSYLFGNPSMIIPLDLAIAKMPPPIPTVVSHSNGELLMSESERMYQECLGERNIPENISTVGLIEGYKFGSIGAVMSTPPLFENLNEIELLNKAKNLISSQQSLKDLDECLHWLIYQWDIYHAATRVSRCNVTLILNRSPNAIQIMSANLRAGRHVFFYGSSTSYEEDSRSILPGGFVVIFSCGVTPSFLDAGKIQLHLVTGAFEAKISNQILETTCSQFNDYAAGFLEKISVEWWSKYVILVK